MTVAGRQTGTAIGRAEGSPGRRRLDGAKAVSIFGKKRGVKSAIHALNAIRAHAGEGRLMGWLGHLAPAKPGNP